MLKLSSTHLQTVCTPVAPGRYVQPLVAEMWRVMYEGRGIGLAANQVGQASRIIVVHAGGLKQAIVNPVITKRYGGRHTAVEGCLSLPGVQVRTVRAKQIIVEGFDPEWQPVRFKLKGTAARCVQHEVDHLDGITI